MKIIYHSDNLRLLVEKRKMEFVGDKIIRLTVQTGKSFFIWFMSWKNEISVDIRLEEYWNPTRGTAMEIRDHLTLHDNCGHVLEVYWPEDFDLDRRIAALWSEYFVGQRALLKAKKAMENI